MQENRFQALQIFEDNRINIAIDSIYSLLESRFGDLGDRLSVCGSVARILAGDLTDEYHPKDTDMVINDALVWRWLIANIQHIQNAQIIREERRFILHYQGFCIEIWMKIERETHKGIYKHQIHYCYGNKN